MGAPLDGAPHQVVVNLSQVEAVTPDTVVMPTGAPVAGSLGPAV